MIVREESVTEHLRREVQKYLDDPQEQDFLREDIAAWLCWYPAKVREAIYLIIDGHELQDHRAHVKGARTARARRKATP
jgi:hypothetical protein